jgi:hypothetical protein
MIQIFICSYLPVLKLRFSKKSKTGQLSFNPFHQSTEARISSCLGAVFDEVIEGRRLQMHVLLAGIDKA